MHQNYDKKYIGRGDLSATTQKMTFLNYIHPNSYEQAPVRDTDHRPPRIEHKYTSEEPVADEHEGLNMLNDRMKNSMQPSKKRPVLPSHRMQEFKVEENTLFDSRGPARLIAASQAPIHTPVLEQFMHESNLRRNMGDYNPIVHAQPKQLNILMEESAISQLSNSEAFERIPRAPSNRQIKIYQQEVRAASHERKQGERSLLHSSWRPKGMEVVSSQMGASSHYNILDQFMR
jgi:hypothetical protein